VSNISSRNVVTVRGHWENLVLCHPRCNRILGDRSLKEKIKLRERRQRKIWIASLRLQ
jgi:hypothetical protein